MIALLIILVDVASGGCGQAENRMPCLRSSMAECNTCTHYTYTEHIDQYRSECFEFHSADLCSKWNYDSSTRQCKNYFGKDCYEVGTAAGNIFETDVMSGDWGGACTCPDGQVYQVADNNDYCGSLACIGGIPGECNRSVGPWSKNWVKCAADLAVDEDGGEDCFSAHAQVMDKNYGLINMEDVAVGDLLLTDQGFYTEVVGWLHREKNRRSKFLEIVFYHEATNKTLTITENHHVRLTDGALVEAVDVDVGSLLMGVDGSPKQVIDVREGYWTGVWAPLTRSGTVAVDGIQCSIYANGPAFEPVMHAFTYPWRNGWVVVPKDTDLLSVLGSLPKLYLNVVSWLKASEFV